MIEFELINAESLVTEKAMGFSTLKVCSRCDFSAEIVSKDVHSTIAKVNQIISWH